MGYYEVLKKWGKEVWIYNGELYCFKKLHFNKGAACSYHYHIDKDEIFYVEEGAVLVLLGERFDFRTLSATIFNPYYLKKGDMLHVPTHTPHKIIGIFDINILSEVSTHHEDSDSYRIN